MKNSREALSLRVEGPDMETRDYKPDDLLPSGCSAARQVVQCAPIMDKETRALAVAFLRQSPKGPQL
ncbi:MAG: hypothetical protein WC378_12500 [Opitutaceae bacterium]